MTLANKITVLRIIAIPLFVIALWENAFTAARVLFVLCVLSDAADGAIARWRGERTALGTFLDPLADKLLLMATFITLTAMGDIPVWVLVSVLSRDMIIVMGWSIVYILTHNRKIEPRILGKVTTALQMGTAVAKLFAFPDPIYHGFLYCMIATTIISAFDYMWEGNRRLGEMQ